MGHNYSLITLLSIFSKKGSHLCEVDAYGGRHISLRACLFKGQGRDDHRVLFESKHVEERRKANGKAFIW